MAKLRIAIITLFILFYNCVGTVTVSELSFLEPLYKVKENKIISIDTVYTNYEKLYKVKYRR
jgi:hypothetical protein